MNRWRSRALGATVSAVLAGGALAAIPAQASDDVTINLVAVNDFHGRIDENVVQWAATVEQLLADGPAASTLLLSAGDNVGATVAASAVQHDDPTLDVLNLLGVDASAAGNHEFDRGYDDLVHHIMARADFPILAANVTRADGSSALEASTTYTVSGVRLAVVGAVTQETPELVEPSGIAGLSFGDPVAGINAEVDRLDALPEDEQPDVIVAVIHEGAPWGTWSLEQAMQSSARFASIVDDTSPDVDAIITGHTHNTYVYDAPVPGKPDRTRPIIQTGHYGANVGQIRLTVATDTGEVTAHTARNVERVTTSDADLVAGDPTLAQIADIRDAAVAYAIEHGQAVEAAQDEYDAAVTDRDQAYAAAESAKADYDAAVAERQEAVDAAAGVKERWDAASAAGKAAYETAAGIKQEYDAAVAAGKASYDTATRIKQEYDAAVADGKQSYADAVALTADYLAAVAAGQQSYATAASVKQDYDAAVASGRQSYADAALIKQEYDTSAAAGKQAYADAAVLKEQYLQLMASGDPDAITQAGVVAQQYVDAIAAGDAAYAKAAATKDRYDAAIAAAQASYTEAAAMSATYLAAVAAGKDSYARASALVEDYRELVAAAQTSYARAAAMKGDYDAAVSAGQESYATAAGLGPSYQAAITSGQTSYATAETISQEYTAAVAEVDAATEKATGLKAVLDAAVATLNATLDAVADLAKKLLSLGIG